MDFDPLSDNEEDVTFMPEKKKKDKEGKKYLKHNIKQTTCFLFINISFISIFKCIPKKQHISDIQSCCSFDLR